MLFISHDLSVVRYLADRIVVMYLGRIMEQGKTEDIFSPPYHPYTEALLAAVPIADTHVSKRHVVLEGEIPSPLTPLPGCPFQTRCQYAMKGTCDSVVPPFKEMGDGHIIACHLPEDELRAMLPVIEVKSAPTPSEPASA
jgi:peptide/nickel transport system ATP-binding protein